ncbi:MAG: stage II sporulation protein P [Bacillota bacterium]|nr:stage II sporulation protein P [Bacillota bacterium]
MISKKTQKILLFLCIIGIFLVFSGFSGADTEKIFLGFVIKSSVAALQNDNIDNKNIINLIKNNALKNLIGQSLAVVYTVPENEVQNKTNKVTKTDNTTQKETDKGIPKGILETTIKKGSKLTCGIPINNETDYTIDNIGQPQMKFSGNGPLVLIVHTHTSESYRPSEAYNYQPTDTDRTEDLDFTVAKVGNVLAKTLEDKGIKTIHDSTINDYPSYSGSYRKSLELMQKYLKQYPSIQIVIDLHRDAMVQSDGTKISTVCEVDGQKAAQIMIVEGTNGSGLEHPNWKENLSFGAALQKKLDESYVNLARPLNLRKERFNGQVSKGHLIVEVGTTGNTLDEALVSAKALGTVLANLIQGMQ